VLAHEPTEMTAAIHSAQATAGLYGPLPLSRTSQLLLPPLINSAAADPSPRNLHSRSELAREVICDAAIRESVRQLFGQGYQLWRTNFFHRATGTPHAGVGWHHDKHFQNGDDLVDFNEVGDHISIVIALDQIDHTNGPFQYIPGSFSGVVSGLDRDTRPYHKRSIEDHFLTLPAEITTMAVLMPIPAGHFCIFQSALLHGSPPSGGAVSRTSMVGRLVRNHCHIPEACAAPEEISQYC
jgi:ectoine hydroxylase-related dioxygenase (phytanoyl-CoA dioxygenase family)